MNLKAKDWYNADNTAYLNLNQVGFWIYKNGTLTVFIAGSELHFNGDEAKEIYKKLTSEKEIL